MSSNDFSNIGPYLVQNAHHFRHHSAQILVISMSGKPGMKHTGRKSLPNWSHDFLTFVDGSSSLGYALRQRHQALQDYVSGGDPDMLTYPQRSLIRRALWLEARIESDEELFAFGEPLAPGSHATLLNSLVAIYRLLGIEPKVKHTQSLSDYIEANK